MNKKNTLLAIITIGLLIIPTFKIFTIPKNPLLGKWKLESNPKISISFTETSISGNDGCNSYSTPYEIYEITENKIKVGPDVISTKRYCRHPQRSEALNSPVFKIRKEAKNLKNALLKSKKFNIKKNKLTLHYGNKKIKKITLIK